MSLRTSTLRIDPADNVLVALSDLAAGTRLEGAGAPLVTTEAIPAKHKIFMEDMAEGSEVVMYGVVVGRMRKPAARGSRMTTGNTVHASGQYAYRGTAPAWQAPDVTAYRARNFMGYARADGEVGTANYWLFIPTVFCENRNLDAIKDAMLGALGYATTDQYRAFANALSAALAAGGDLAAFDPELAPAPRATRLFENVDGIKFLNHTGGCGGTRQDAQVLGKLLAAYADHPNVAGVTLLSLGCQHLQVEDFQRQLKARNPQFDKPLLVFEQQQAGSEAQLIKDAIRATYQGLVQVNRQGRAPAPLSKLVLGVKCGGSDGFSGISANPAVGYAADMLVALGGRVLLAEFPELCGAEQNLLDRCVGQQQADRFIQLMQDYDAQARAVGSGFHMNPSPGNIRDGLITDAIKSAGAAKKGGTSPVVDVLDYTEPARRAGLSLVCTPGNDVEATTGQAASGATLILFTTGLGTPTGNPVCPTIKVSTNRALAERMPDIIDIDCGPVVDGAKSLAQMGADILDYCIAAASGEVVPKAVQLGQDDFIPWKRGVSL